MKDITTPHEVIPSFLFNLFAIEKKQMRDNLFNVYEILDSPLRVRLIRQYYESINKNTNSYIWKTINFSIQSVINQFSNQDALTNLLLQIEKDNVFINDTIQLYEDETVYLIKAITKKALQNYSFIENTNKHLQISGYIAEKNQITVTKLKTVFLVLDASYNENSLLMKEITKWEKNYTEQLINDRIILHTKGPFICSDKDKWTKKSFVVGNKSYTSINEAHQESISSNIPIIIEETQLRCLYKCEVKNFCPEYKELNYNKIKT